MPAADLHVGYDDFRMAFRAMRLACADQPHYDPVPWLAVARQMEATFKSNPDLIVPAAEWSAICQTEFLKQEKT